MPTRVRSYCKINLGLAVGPLRDDGFHALTTVYQTLQLHDFVTVTATPSAATSILLTSNHRAVPRTEAGTAERNTAYRIIDRVLTRLGLTATVEIHIEKHLPVQGGMGAGSANAIAAMLGLERELRVAMTASGRLEVAEEVGSDVPLFLLRRNRPRPRPRRRSLPPPRLPTPPLCHRTTRDWSLYSPCVSTT